MQLFTRLLLLSVAVIGANAWPRSGDDQSLLRMVMAEVGFPSAIEDRAMSPAENACYVAYNNATNQVANQLSNATNKCEVAANRTMVTNYQSTNSSVNLIRSQLLQLEQNLQRCRNETDSARLINCTVSYFDANLRLLDSSNSQAYQVKSQIAANSSNISLQRTSCVSAAISECKVKNIEAANAYDNCLSMIPYQRDLILHGEAAPGTAQGAAPGTVQGQAPASAPSAQGSAPGTAPSAQGSAPSAQGSAPSAQGSAPGTAQESAPSAQGSAPGTAQESAPGTAPSARETAPGTAQESAPGAAPGTFRETAPGTAPESAPGAAPGTA